MFYGISMKMMYFNSPVFHLKRKEFLREESSWVFFVEKTGTISISMTAGLTSLQSLTLSYELDLRLQ